MGIDVSKRWVDFAACEPGRPRKTRRAAQDWPGFEQVQGRLRRLQDAGQGVWAGLEPTGPYSVCLQEWLLKRRCRVGPSSE